MFFAKPNVAKTINEHLTRFGYELNNDFVGIYKMAGHSACGEASSQERNTGHSACGDTPRRNMGHSACGDNLDYPRRSRFSLPVLSQNIPALLIKK